MGRKGNQQFYLKVPEYAMEENQDAEESANVFSGK
jgi:hypothetical protein